MPTDKRQRKRQGHQARRAAAANAARERRARRTRAVAAGFLGLVLVAGLVVVIGGGNDPGTDVASTGPTTTAASSSSTTARKTPVSLPPLTPGATIKGDTPCPPADGSAPRTTSFEKPPPLCVAVARTYTAEILTSKGLMVANLDVKGATKTVNNFVVLARYHYFDGIAFHRIVPGFVVQGGDPMQSGTGGPGYRFEDELPKAGAYKVGSLAMAKTGPDTNGSQFFIVTGDAGTSLPPQYSLFGQITQGLDVLKAIEDTGIAGTQDGRPSEVVTIRSVTIKES